MDWMIEILMICQHLGVSMDDKPDCSNCHSDCMSSRGMSGLTDIKLGRGDVVM